MVRRGPLVHAREGGTDRFAATRASQGILTIFEIEKDISALGALGPHHGKTLQGKNSDNTISVILTPRLPRKRVTAAIPRRASKSQDNQKQDC
jgi:hypothetical protein